MKKPAVTVLMILAVLSLIVSVMYFTENAGNLPHFFLGYAAYSAHKHTKHAVAFLVLAIVFVLGAWMLSGQDSGKRPASKQSSKKDQ